MLKIVEYINEHGLAKALSVFRLKTRVYEHKILIKYDQLASPMGEREVQECRGLILERNTWKVMSLPFYKFFNSAEGHAATIDWDTAHILEKLDGTMIHTYYDWHKDTWFAATSGTGEGEGEVNNKLGTTFNELFWKTVKDKYDLTPSDLVKDYVYVFELTTPYNIVVKPHGESSATLLTVRDRTNLQEFDYKSLRNLAIGLGVPLVMSFDLNDGNVGRLLRTFENMVWYDEGYVVVDGNFNRIKVKNPAYVAVHHLKSKTSEHAIMSVVKTNEIDEFAATFPEREEEVRNLTANYLILVKKLEDVWGILKEHKPKNITKGEQKKFAMKVFEVCEAHGVKQFNGLYFALKDAKVDSVQDFMFNYDDKTLYKML